jgi:tyrosyl-tRNA synthetase
VSLSDRAVDVVPEDGLERLPRDRPWRVKFGVDPTAPDIHLGHAVVLDKLREFQDAGHTAVLILGDWTARVGDPSGRTAARPMLSGEEIEENVATYREQAFRILDPARTEMRPNGEWFEPMRLPELFRLAATTGVGHLLAREDFRTRLDEGRPLTVLELLYPLMQAYDSVMVRADVELGGTDQLFNLVLARDVQRAYGQPPQVAMTMPILPGTDGVRRMSKSTGNYVGVAEPPEEQFGKVMKVPDESMAEFYRLLLPAAPAPSGHPGEEKRRLARGLVERFHGPEGARAGEAHFDRLFRERRAPDEVAEVAVRGGTVHLPALLVDGLGVSSRSEARRLIEQGGVTLDGDPVSALDADAADLDGRILRAGKRRFARVRRAPENGLRGPGSAP